MSNLVSHITVNYPELNKPLDGRYQVVEILAARLWGRTYLAQDLRRPSQSECIIHHMKTIPDIPDYTDVARCLFAREAAMLEEFGTHEQIPQLLACFEDSYGFYVVQEFIVGHPLDAELQPGMRWSSEQVIGLLREALEPLAFIHHYGCVHGNLKPDNLLRRMSDSQLVLINVGSMRQIQLSFIAAHGQMIPPTDAAQQGYQPIEQVQGFLCPASDVYAIGMIAVQALTGVHPTEFQVNPKTGEIFWQNHCPASTSGVQQALIDILNGMVQWDLTQRFATAGEVLNALQDLLSAVTPADDLPPLSIPAAIANPPTFIVNTPKSIEAFQGLVSAPADSSMEVESPEIANLEAIADSPTPTTNASTEVIKPLAIHKSATPTHEPSLQTGSASAQPRPTSARPAPDAKSQFQLTRLLIGALSKPSVRIGVGSTVLSIVFALIGWNLLMSLNWVEASNQIWEKVTKKFQDKQNGQANQQAGSGAAGSVTPRTAKMVVAELTTEWSTASNTVQQAEQALNQGQWAEVRELTKDLPKIPYWEQRGAAVAQQANGKAEVAANQLLQTAYDQARERNFTEALTSLKQIPAGIPAEEIAEAKIQEYTKEQAIKAQADLQKAYDRAIVRDFTAALEHLRKIPTGTPAYAIAQKKVVEYTQKQKIRAQVLLKAANEQAANQDFLAALTSLEKAQGTHFDAEVEVKIAEYTERLNQQANQWLQQANQQAGWGNMAGALAALEKIPIGTPAYAQAREKIAEYANKPDRQLKNDTIAMQNSDALQDLNPGNYLREVTPFTASRVQNVK